MDVQSTKIDYRDARTDEARWIQLYRAMLRQRLIDEKMLHLQRQGRIRFYAPSIGQEAATIGSVSALKSSDWIVPALRENAAALYRGLPLEAFLGQHFGNRLDPTKGRQMPGHLSYPAGNFVSTSTCIASQLPHAVGIGMALRGQGKDAGVLAYLGDGATSEGDFHSALNLAGVYQAPVVFFCVNNQLAISMSVDKQTASPSLAIKASAYGFQGYQIDGNDVLEVRQTTKKAMDAARKGSGPALIEAITFRYTASNTSDDPSKYIDDSQVRAGKRKDPLVRFRKFLEKANLWTPKKEESAIHEFETEIKAALTKAEKAPGWAKESVIEDVYASVPRHLKEQWMDLVSNPWIE